MAAIAKCRLCGRKFCYTQEDIWRLGEHLHKNHPKDDITHFSFIDSRGNKIFYSERACGDSLNRHRKNTKNRANTNRILLSGDRYRRAYMMNSEEHSQDSHLEEPKDLHFEDTSGVYLERSSLPEDGCKYCPNDGTNCLDECKHIRRKSGSPRRYDYNNSSTTRQQSYEYERHHNTARSSGSRRYTGDYDSRSTSDINVKNLEIKRRKGVFRTTVESWRQSPTLIVCPYCKRKGQPIIRKRQNKIARSSLGALCLLGCWPLCFFPFILSGGNILNLYCKNCGHFLGTYDRRTGDYHGCDQNDDTIVPPNICGGL